MKPFIIIIGAGAWGQALAYVCHKTAPETTIFLICREGKPVNTHAIHPKLKHAKIKLENNLAAVIEKTSPVIIATPSTSIADILATLNHLNHQGDILCTAKGFIDKPGIPYPHELYSSINPKTKSFAYLYGPTFAEEVLDDLPTQAILASSSPRSRKLWQNSLNNKDFQTLASTDLKGLAWCSVFKNIIAIVSGFMQACHLGKNAQAILITHATVELQRVIKKIKGNPNTAHSLAGIGDIILSASPQSRNFKYGQQLAENSSEKINTIEGKSNLQLITKKFKSMQEEKPPIITLAENCIQKPKQSKLLIIKWIQSKTKSLLPNKSAKS